jgi:hypothetical protein
MALREVYERSSERTLRGINILGAAKRGPHFTIPNMMSAMHNLKIYLMTNHDDEWPKSCNQDGHDKSTRQRCSGSAPGTTSVASVPCPHRLLN